MKKFLYNLDGKVDSYSIKEIADYLNIDDEFLEEVLIEKNYDLDLACMTSINEKNKKNAIKKMLDIYPTKYVCSNNLNELINNQLEIRNNKRRFLNSLKYLTNYNDNEFIVLDKQSLNTIIVNTEDDVDKRIMNNEGLSQIKAIKSLFNDNFENSIYKSSKYLSLVSYNKNDNNVSISVDVAKNLLSYLNDFKLPINYNVTITEELINENNKKDNKSFIYKYIKK